MEDGRWEKLMRQRRSADFQSAVSPTCSRQTDRLSMDYEEAGNGKLKLGKVDRRRELKMKLLVFGFLSPGINGDRLWA
jgi:hypothetical protein